MFRIRAHKSVEPQSPFFNLTNSLVYGRASFKNPYHFPAYTIRMQWNMVGNDDMGCISDFKLRTPMFDSLII